MSESIKQLTCLGITHCLQGNTLFLPLHDANVSEYLRQNYEPTDNEIWIVTYPKTGTTLTLQICHEIMNCYYNKTKSKNDIYYAQNDDQYTKTEWIDVVRNMSLDGFNKFIQATKNTKRFWKTHCKLEYLPCKTLPKKMIICCRNPKDALVSFYHHTKNADMKGLYNFKSSFSAYFTLWVAGLVENNSYFEYYQKYWNFYIENMKNNNSKTEIFWLNYEDLVKDNASKRKMILKLIEFIGVGNVVNSEQDIKNILNKTSIKKMRKQYEGSGIKNFVRKGIVSDWKNYLNREQNEIMDTLIRVHFNGTDFKYYKDLQNKKEYLCFVNIYPIKSKL